MRQKIRTRVVAALMLTAGTLLMTAPVARAGLTAEQQCQKGRHDAAATYAQCEYKAMGQFFAGGDLTKLNVALSKCRVKYTNTWVKLQKKALGTGATCDSNRFVDNGRTVTDHLTGLQWEQKTDDGSVHDKDNVYGWFAASSIFLAENGGLNNHPDVFCFASRCDWRLPTRAELQTILSEPFPCTTSPCIAGIFGPTAASGYWSSTTDAVDGSVAWSVNFFNGVVSSDLQANNGYVRAVRGGL